MTYNTLINQFLQMDL